MSVKMEPPAIRMARKMHMTRTQNTLLSVFFFILSASVGYLLLSKIAGIDV